MRFIDWLLNALRSPPLLNIRHLCASRAERLIVHLSCVSMIEREHNASRFISYSMYCTSTIVYTVQSVCPARRSEAGGSAVVSANHVDLTLKYKEGFLYNVAGALENALVERKARIAEVPHSQVHAHLEYFTLSVNVQYCTLS